MLTSAYDYTVLFCAEDGKALAQSPIEVDWQPAIESVRLTALCENAPSALGGDGAHPVVAPEWHPEVGEPYIKGFSVKVPELGRSVGFTNTYFAKYAQAGSAALVEQGKLKLGDKFLYLVLALPRSEQPSEPSRVHFRAAEPVPVHAPNASLASFLAAAEPTGIHHAGDMPVFVPRQLLDEVTEIYRQKCDTETGGVLVGGLRRSDDGQIFLEVTAQIPAQHTEAGATHLTFTGETWKAVRAAIAIRNRGELWVGWWHTHPVRSWTSEEGEASATSNTPVLSGGFFSAQDSALHRAAFVGAYSVALVVSDLGPKCETYSLFGWRAGVVVSRGFHILEREVATVKGGAGQDRARTELARREPLPPPAVAALARGGAPKGRGEERLS
jgi:hypothetical protein